MLNYVGARVEMRCLAGLLLAAACCYAQIVTPTPTSTPKDPGVRGGPPGAGGTFKVLDNTNPTADQVDHDFFAETLARFQEVDSVSGTIEGGNGLGPGFNHNSCAGCHIQPAMGGGSPATNPQVQNADGSAFAHLDGASNPADTSKFLSLHGPVREVRFIQNSDGTPDGGVHDIFTIAGRTDAPGCNLAQPDFDTAINNNNAIFRIPISAFGDGLVELTSDAALADNLAANSAAKANLGIGGTLNHSGNDGSVTRFGWKAQNKSMLMFAGEAYNVEQGVTSELFGNDRFPGGTADSVIANCTFNGDPEDATNTINPQPNTIVNGVTKPNPNRNTPIGTASEMSSDIVNFAAFARLLAPPTPAPTTSSATNGQKMFEQIGCALCHSETLTTEAKSGNGAGGGANGPFPALNGMTYHPFSDYAIHHMGSTLADGVTQGAAGPDQFRTAPLWGAGQRIFFLHDGRTTDLLVAIQDHFSAGSDCVSINSTQSFTIEPGGINYNVNSSSHTCGSEANQVINAFNGLNGPQKQDILNFLRSL